jgi:NTP pyrophosphatase (non-canonical NTP hydrolase)
MNAADYLKNALNTESRNAESQAARLNDGSLRLLHSGLGLATEAGEFLDVIKKYIYYGKAIDRVNLVGEIGDVLWYCAIALDELGVSFEQCMQANYRKLKARYPNKFNNEDAIERNIEEENSILAEALMPNT